MATQPHQLSSPPPPDGAVLLGQPDTEPKIEELTFVDLTGLAFTKATLFRNAAGQNQQPGAAREFSLAITALEDALMRFNRGAAMLAGVFDIADVEAQYGLAVQESTETTKGGE